MATGTIKDEAKHQLIEGDLIAHIESVNGQVAPIRFLCKCMVRPSE